VTTSKTYQRAVPVGLLLKPLAIFCATALVDVE